MSVCLDGRASDTIMTANGKYVWIDTCWVRDRGFRGAYETMVFKSDEYGNVKSWTELDEDLCFKKEEADEQHAKMINKWMKEVVYESNL